MERLVVIGGGYAGVLASVRATRRARALGLALDVTLISDRDELVERIRLHEAAVRDREVGIPIRSLIGREVRFVRGRVSGLDRVRRAVEIEGSAPVAYDRLIIAIGSESDPELVPGAAEHAFFLEPSSIAALRERISRHSEGRIAVLGGGLSGIELAAEIAERHPSARVTIITSGEAGETLSAPARDHLLSTLRQMQIALREHTKVSAITRSTLQLEGEVIPFDVCICTAGFRAPRALAQWGLPVDARGRARVDATLALEGDPRVLVAGDCALPSGTTGTAIPSGCKSAMPLGAHAADRVIEGMRNQAPTRFDFVHPGLCISLGRRRGLIQLMNSDGTPARTHFTGSLGAFIKEQVCRYTITSIHLERARLFSYRWLHSAPRGAERNRPSQTQGSASSTADEHRGFDPERARPIRCTHDFARVLCRARSGLGLARG